MLKAMLAIPLISFFIFLLKMESFPSCKASRYPQVSLYISNFPRGGFFLLFLQLSISLGNAVSDLTAYYKTIRVIPCYYNNVRKGIVVWGWGKGIAEDELKRMHLEVFVLPQKQEI